MQKIIFRPICHLSFEQANTIYEEIRSTQGIYSPQQGSVLQRGFEHSGYTNSMVSNNNPLHIASNSNEKVFNPNTRANRMNSLPENTQYGMTNPNSNNFPLIGPQTPTMSPAENKGSQKMISKDSIIRKYDDFFGEKVNVEALKEENSRLYYEKLALEASVQKLKDQNLKKDGEISRLKQFIENSKNVHNQPPKPLQGFQSQVVNQPSPQVHFRPAYEQKRPY